MASPSGYVVLLSEERMEAFLECVEDKQRFGQPVREFQHSRHVPLVCFVVADGQISHVALGKRGTRSGTGLRRLNLEKAEKLARSVPASDIVSRLPKRNQAYTKKRFTEGGLLTEKSFAAVVDTLRQLSPGCSKIVERYSSERTERVNRLSSAAREQLAFQKEALLTALAIAGIGRDEVQQWAPPSVTPTSFLDGLPKIRLREDQMIVHDLMHIPGFEMLTSTPHNAAIFDSESERLTVILANRLPLEKQTGTDLIYFNETYKSFVLVQYKAMEHEDDDNGVPHAVFRLPNIQLTEELKRMDSLLAQLRSCNSNALRDGFRLTDNPFFLKLCPRLVFNPDDVRLVPGMYLPLDYWKLIEQDAAIVGSRGGRQVTYENVGRHFDNSAFSTVVAKAWVGTTPSQSAVLGEVIRITLETGKAAAFAVKSSREGGPAQNLPTLTRP